MYPVKRNGSEYYKYRTPNNFLKAKNGGERYAFDVRKGEIYPKRGPLYARNKTGKLYYARDLKGDEKYGIRNKKSVLISRGQFAKCKSGKERYPHDHKGNEYYLTKNDEPYLLRDENGIKYFARDRKKNTLIPWNYYNNNDKQWVETVDSNNNEVYTNDCFCSMNCICPASNILKRVVKNVASKI
ncbi:hypothetical protein TNCT_229531 [Trichonephila clavata]|uniref:Uncharacterized protein n=1 Tax=Trichonephila clavata TaxID=2740835 RepID=A0A8X6G0V3_TRICU|nr:hypothetical protein TNCT_556071 [Trichonephila clavata]GFR12285.1 hypothetical protein TNCT_103461 [Trichonephila clavata]GFR29521.1 hypothetical protein TNCT_229531 [Trichonephila clavata]